MPDSDYFRGIAAYDAGWTPYRCEHADCKDRAAVGLCEPCFAMIHRSARRAMSAQ